MKLRLHATPEEVMRAVEALEQFGRERGVGDPELFGLALALEECGSNVVNHALQLDARKTFSVNFQHSRNSLVIELRDSGPEFDPTAVIVDKSEKDDLPGGWGIELVRRYTDEIRYERESDRNVLRLTKHLGVANRAK